MADSKVNEKFAKLAGTASAVPPPPFPKIPKAIKDRHPETAAAWGEYERAIDLWVKAVLVSKTLQ